MRNKEDQSLGNRSMPGMPMGIPKGTIGKYAKAPPMDQNHVAQEKGNGEKNQLGFNKKLGV